ncbi:hypothetical protein BOTBODRAFT_54316 [Botryobasidium botryosum FD-172 SS1]|uniref:DUF4139 domain-containing protein n=1 Tax=Botryobasidium botryosum (strain FD-172 SS1) TaxID=930990 RepID=A0A067MJB1_BOTB1|nr:hypothetical protein BOTBODRAFT_54316 [Botryobasidium botryosum FD-172 SS1]
MDSIELVSNHIVPLDAAQHPVKSVVVFKGVGAEVTRAFSVNIKAGQNNIKIKNLPSCIDQDSIQVRGLGGATLFDVAFAAAKAKPFPPGYLQESEYLKSLNAKLSMLEGRKRHLDYQADILVGYAKSFTAEHVKPDAFEAFLARFDTLGKSNLEDIAEIKEEIRNLKADIEKEKQNPLAEEDQSYKREASITAVVQTSSDKKVELSLTYFVTRASWVPVYDLRTTSGDSGHPASTVTLQCKAAIQQTTGESWNNASLSLSTGGNAHASSSAVPLLSTLKITPAGHASLFGGDSTNAAIASFRTPMANAAAFGSSAFGQPASAQSQLSTLAMQQQQQHHMVQQLQQQMQQQRLPPQPAVQLQQPQASQPGGFPFGAAPTASAQGEGGGGVRGDDQWVDLVNQASMPEPALEPVNTNPFENANAVATDSVVAATYQIEGRSTIPSDNSTHKVTIFTAQLEGDIEWIVVPRVRTIAYLLCRIKNITTKHFLPGAVNIFLDDTFVAKSDIGHVGPQDSFLCSLGPDPKLKITFSHTEKKKDVGQHAFAPQTDTVTCTNRITLKNTRQTALRKVTVRDTVPITSDSQFKVVLREPQDLATIKAGERVPAGPGVVAQWTAKRADGSGGENEGRMEWVCQLEPGAATGLSLVWDVTSPTGTKWKSFAA